MPTNRLQGDKDVDDEQLPELCTASEPTKPVEPQVRTTQAKGSKAEGKRQWNLQPQVWIMLVGSRKRKGKENTSVRPRYERWREESNQHLELNAVCILQAANWNKAMELLFWRTQDRKRPVGVKVQREFAPLQTILKWFGLPPRQTQSKSWDSGWTPTLVTRNTEQVMILIYHSISLTEGYQCKFLFRPQVNSVFNRYDRGSTTEASRLMKVLSKSTATRTYIRRPENTQSGAEALVTSHGQTFLRINPVYYPIP